MSALNKSPGPSCKLLFPTFFLVLGLHVFSAPAHAGGVLTVAGSGADLATMRLLAQEFISARPGVSIEVLPSIGSGGAAKALTKGAIDLGLGSRPLKEAEKARGVEQRLYAKTPLVIVVSPNVPGNAITSAELVKIYEGALSKWPNGLPIRPILRPRGESDTQILEAGILGLAAASQVARARNVPLAMSDQDNADMMEQAPGAIGASTLALILAEKRRLKALALDGVVPNPDTLADGSYALYKPLYFFTREPTKPLATEFMNFVLTKGVTVLKATGHLVME
ncbi:MAG: substrate-binding domain-containing protein [Gammaproteobacteria bacterium]|nr:substrate-binding domain-containing protein [Gammaproteobacteria bacterium]